MKTKYRQVTKIFGVSSRCYAIIPKKIFQNTCLCLFEDYINNFLWYLKYLIILYWFGGHCWRDQTRALWYGLFSYVSMDMEGIADLWKCFVFNGDSM